MAKNKTYSNEFGDNDFSSTTSSTTGSGTSGLKGKAAGLQSKIGPRVEESPLVALGAGLALGAALGAVVPASRKERELLQPLGSKITTASTDAIDRSRTMAKQKFDEMAGDKLREFLGASGSNS